MIDSSCWTQLVMLYAIMLPPVINSMIYDLSKPFPGTNKIELSALQRFHSTARTMTAESSSSPNSVPFIRIPGERETAR